MQQRRTAQLRTTVIGLTVALLGVLALDATTIVAAPASPATVKTALPAALSPPSGLRVIKWAGEQWLVSPTAEPGPESHVHMTDSPAAVHVDSKGRLHLKIIKVNGVWRSVELQLLGPATYGTYSWGVRGNTSKFSKNVVLGMFVYQNTGTKFANEIDIEDSRFTHWIDPNDAQYVVQPYYGTNHWCPYRSPNDLTLQTQSFRWTPNRVKFFTRRGASRHGALEKFRCDRTLAKRLAAQATHRGVPTGSTVSHPGTSFIYRGSDVPTPDRQRIIINFWTNMNRSPTHGTRSVVLDSFHLTPSD